MWPHQPEAQVHMLAVNPNKQTKKKILKINSCSSPFHIFLRDVRDFPSDDAALESGKHTMSGVLKANRGLKENMKCTTFTH